mmetsp:Transcript_6826/g.19129  ORF Transcript_6826/g.19129 Transcript_6826/m.19129 type:complete len:331 (+) Transcript_6826:618-1610(+)
MPHLVQIDIAQGCQALQHLRDGRLEASDEPSVGLIGGVNEVRESPGLVMAFRIQSGDALQDDGVVPPAERMVVLHSPRHPAHLLEGSARDAAAGGDLETPAVPALEDFGAALRPTGRLLPPIIGEILQAAAGLAEDAVLGQAAPCDLLLPVISFQNKRHDTTTGLQGLDEGRQVHVAIQPPGVQVLRGAVASHDGDDACLPKCLEERGQQATILDGSDGHLVEAKQRPHLSNDAPRDHVGRPLVAPNLRLRLVHHAVDHVHELVEVHASAAAQVMRNASVEEVHDHALAGAHGTMDVQALDGRAFAARNAASPKAVENGAQHVDDAFLVF